MMIQDGLRKLKTGIQAAKDLPANQKRDGWKDEIELGGTFLWRRKALKRDQWKKLGESFIQF